MPRVLNMRKHGTPDGAVYVGRPSKWGNPFLEGVDGTRREVILKFRRWVVQQDRLIAALDELRGRDLVCWCAPCACHADVLLKLANKKAVSK